MIFSACGKKGLEPIRKIAMRQTRFVLTRCGSISPHPNPSLPSPLIPLLRERGTKAEILGRGNEKCAVVGALCAPTTALQHVPPSLGSAKPARRVRGDTGGMGKHAIRQYICLNFRMTRIFNRAMLMGRQTFQRKAKTGKNGTPFSKLLPWLGCFCGLFVHFIRAIRCIRVQFPFLFLHNEFCQSTRAYSETFPQFSP